MAAAAETCEDEKHCHKPQPTKKFFNRLEGDCVSALKVDEDIKHCRRERLRLKTKQKQFCARLVVMATFEYGTDRRAENVCIVYIGARF